MAVRGRAFLSERPKANRIRCYKGAMSGSELRQTELRRTDDAVQFASLIAPYELE